MGMRRRVWDILTGASLVRCLAVAVFWVGGFGWHPSAVWRESRPLTEVRHAVDFGQGGVNLSVLSPVGDRESEVWF